MEPILLISDQSAVGHQATAERDDSPVTVSIPHKGVKMARRSSFKLSQQEEEKLQDVKIQICLAIRRAMGRQTHYSSTVTAMKLGTSRACVSRVQRAIAKDLTFNQLFRYLVRLEPNFKILVAI